MLAFLSLPIGAIAILVLHLLKTPKKMLWYVFFVTLVFAFVANIAEWGSATRTICEIFKIDNFTRFFSEIFIFVTAFGAIGLFSVKNPSTGHSTLRSFDSLGTESSGRTSESLRLEEVSDPMGSGNNKSVPERSPFDQLRVNSAESKNMQLTPSLRHSVTSSDPEIVSALLLLATFAMVLVAASTSVISLFLAMEFLAIAFYELVALKKDRIGMEAAIKFFVVGVFSSLLFLLGAAFYYGALGTTNFNALLGANLTPFLAAALVLMLAGIGFKMSIFPLNLWLPDVYQGSPGSITAILAGAAKKAGFAAYLRFFIPFALPLARFGNFGIGAESWKLLIALLAAATMIFGAVAAAVQQNVKRLIAYSIISHAGFIAIGLAAGTRLGYRAALLHIAIHALMALGVFVMIEELERRGIYNLEDYSGIAKNNHTFAAMFTIFLASLTGVPPLAGFISKFLLLSSAVGAGLTWLAVVAVIASVISSYFYFIILRRMYGYEPKAEGYMLHVTCYRSVPFAVPAVLVVIFGFVPQLVLQIVSSVV